MIHAPVSGELFADLSVLCAFVGHQVCLALDVLANDRSDIVLLDAFDVEGTGAALPLDKGENRVLVAEALLDLETPFASDEGFVGLDRHRGSAHRRKAASAHGFADAMPHAPCGPI